MISIPFLEMFVSAFGRPAATCCILDYMKQPVFIAHRGAFLPGRRENTAAAIERAVKTGRFAYIEIDVRRTRSDEKGSQTPIILHDRTLDRLYEQYKVPLQKRHRVGQPVYNLTLETIRAEAIEVTTLAEALRAANGQPVNLEIKSSKTVDAALEVINDMISKYSEWSYEKIVISSFNWKILEEVKRREPELGIAMLYGWRNIPRSFARTYKELGARWIMFDKWLGLFLSPLSSLMKVPNRYVHTVNTEFEVKLYRLLGVTGFTTDVLTLPDKFSIESAPKK